MARFRRAFYKLTPSWLHTGESERVLYSLSLIIDAATERLRQGLLARFPRRTMTPDSLVYLGRDRGIIRGVEESDESYANRLIAWRYPRGHRVRGNAFGLLEQIRAYYAPLGEVRVRTVDVRGTWYTIDYDGTESYNLELGDWDWDGDGITPEWGRFWVIIYTDRLPGDFLLWGDPELWSGTWGGEPGAVWGGSIGDTGDTLRTILKQWKPAGRMPEFIVLTNDPDAFEPGVTNETDGTWDVPENRLPEPRYIPYVN